VRHPWLARVSRYFYQPSLVLIALTVIYRGLFSIFLIPR
jgi:hypothetical protein